MQISYNGALLRKIYIYKHAEKLLWGIIEKNIYINMQIGYYGELLRKIRLLMIFPLSNTNDLMLIWLTNQNCFCNKCFIRVVRFHNNQCPMAL